MRQFYAKPEDEEKCIRSSVERCSITVTGLTPDGDIGAFSGTVQSVEKGHNVFPGYPLRVTISDQAW
jgi:hypothetical protein